MLAQQTIHISLSSHDKHHTSLCSALCRKWVQVLKCLFTRSEDHDRFSPFTPLIFTKGFTRLSGVFLRRLLFKVMHGGVTQYLKYYHCADQRSCLRKENFAWQGSMANSCTHHYETILWYLLHFCSSAKKIQTIKESFSLRGLSEILAISVCFDRFLS